MKKRLTEEILDKFASYFRDYSDNYVLVGGGACTVILKRLLQSYFRRTGDLDMIILVESLTPEFGTQFWKYIKDGGYSVFETKEGQTEFFRFEEPCHEEFPEKVELFSRKQDFINLRERATFTPLHIDDEVSSLSAILLDDDYYYFLKAGKIMVDDFSVLDIPHLIAFKARAYVNLLERRESGIQVNSSEIKKHKNDVFYLSQYIYNVKISPPADEFIKADIRAFLDKTKDRPPVMRNIGADGFTVDEAIRSIKACFSMEQE